MWVRQAANYIGVTVEEADFIDYEIDLRSIETGIDLELHVEFIQMRYGQGFQPVAAHPEEIYMTNVFERISFSRCSAGSRSPTPGCWAAL